MNSSPQKRAAVLWLGAACTLVLAAAAVPDGGQSANGASHAARYELSAHAVLPDTLAVAERAGSVLILPLPPTLRSGAVDSYGSISLPPLSLVRDRSFFWRTSTSEIGVHDLLFEARLSDGGRDTLVVEVSLLPPRG